MVVRCGRRASGSSEPACPFLLLMTPLCIGGGGGGWCWGGPRLTAQTTLPGSAYIWLACHSGAQSCQRRFTACMNISLKCSCSSTAERQRVRLDERFIPTQDWNEAINKHWVKSAVSNSTGSLQMLRVLLSQLLTFCFLFFPRGFPDGATVYLYFLDTYLMDGYDICYSYSTPSS